METTDNFIQTAPARVTYIGQSFQQQRVLLVDAVAQYMDRAVFPAGAEYNGPLVKTTF